MSNNFSVGDLAWMPSTSTQARFTIPPELLYGSNRAAWLPVAIKSMEGGEQLVGTLEWDTKVDIKCKAALVHPRDDGECSFDLSKLKYHNDAAIIHSLGTSFGNMNFTSKIGKYFLCLNPGNAIVSKVGHHHNAAADMLPYYKDVGGAPLSVYTAADIAYRDVAEGLLNKTIVLRGCSGSGKTEISKHIVQYLLFAESPANVAKSSNHTTYTPLSLAHNPLVDVSRSRISKAVAAGVAVMDIFGSAPSGRNPNSSRVIRQTTLGYSLDGRLTGANFQYHMFDKSCLDMSRIDAVAPYRIFSLLSVGIPSSDVRRGDFQVTPSILDDFKSLSATQEENSLADFAYLETLLQAVELSAETWTDIQSILAAVLHLQRLNVSGSDAATISASTKNHVSHAEDLLRMEKGSLGPVLLKKSMDIGGQQTFKNLTQEDARGSILALGAVLYEKSFKYLLQHCSNYSALEDFSTLSGPQLRIIDCCGNENLDNTANQLSQYLINMSEEKMNEHCMFRVFDREEQMFRLEGVPPPPARERPDLAPMASLLDEPPLSIVNILEEVTLMQRGSDKALFDKIFNTHSKGKLIKIASRSAAQTCFVIRHTFGDVQYDLSGFTAANKVEASPDVKRLMCTILEKSFPFLADPVSESLDDSATAEEKRDEKPGRRMTGRASPAIAKLTKKNLTANKARTDLNEILQSINGYENEGEADPMYIFCFKANNDIQSSHYDPVFMAPQVKFFNLAQLSHFCGQGFAKFEPFREFYDRYRVLFPKKFDGLPWKLSSECDHQSLVKVLLQECSALACEPDMLDDDRLAPVYGTTKIFLRDDMLEVLEKLRSTTLLKYSQAATLIQSCARAKKVQKDAIIYRKGFLQFQALVRRYSQRKIYTMQILSIKMIQGYYLTKKLSAHYRSMLSAVEVIKRRLLNKMIQRIRFKRLQRSARSLQFLSRGFIVRQHVSHMIRAALVLQSFASDFIKRLRRFYFRKVAIVRIQQVFRGAQCRHEHRAAVRVLKKRSNQRIGTRAVIRLQSHWRTKMLCHRVQKVTEAAKVIQGWSISRKKRNQFLQILFLTKWLQCTARRLIASNRTQTLHIERMLDIEAEMLENTRTEEVECLTYHSTTKLTELRIGAGFTRNGADKFVRYIIGYDVSFDISSAYPSGWVQTVLDFRKHLSTLGKRRIKHIAVGDSHTVLVDSSSNIFSFGLGDYGQLGRADRRNSTVPKQVDSLRHSGMAGKASLKKNVMENVEVVSVMAGRDHTLVLTSGGFVFSWGGNRRGQLGHSNFNSSAIPRLVEGIKNVKIIATGSYHSCCLADPGIVYTWGARECLGRNSEGNGDECVAKSLPFFSKRRVQTLVSGDSHVVCRSGRSFYSWGSNSFGQLGIGTENEKNDNEENYSMNSPDRFGQGHDQRDNLGKIFPTIVNIPCDNWTEKDFFACQLVSGGRHILLALRNRLWAWGWNAFGQVGIGTRGNVVCPTLIHWHDDCAGKHSSSIAQMTAGWRSSVIITTDGEVFAWGHACMHGSFLSPPPPSDMGDSNAVPNPSSEEKKLPLEEIDPGVSLETPRKVTLPNRLREQNILKLYSTWSNSMSLCAIDVLVKDPPTGNLNKSKFISSRQVNPVTMIDSTTSEFTRMQREKLGSWSSSANMKHKRGALKASLLPQKEDVVDNFDQDVEWGGNDVQMRMTPNKASAQATLRLERQAKREQMEQEQAEALKEREKREGKVSHEGLLGLFSPVHTGNCGSNKARLHVSVPIEGYNPFDDDSTVASGRDDSTIMSSESDGQDMFNVGNNSNNNRAVNTSTMLLPSARSNSNDNMSLAKMAQTRRSSIAAGRPFNTGPGTNSWHATDRGAILPRRRASRMMSDEGEVNGVGIVKQKANRRASVGSSVGAVVRPTASSDETMERVRALDKRKAKKLAQSNKEAHDKHSKFNRDLASLGNDIYRKRETNRDRFKASSTVDAVNASVRGLKGKAAMRRQESMGSESADNGLSLVAVSDLATMIQSIKEESMQSISDSWKL